VSHRRRPLCSAAQTARGTSCLQLSVSRTAPVHAVDSLKTRTS
jgi:hypothetical protein